MPAVLGIQRHDFLPRRRMLGRGQLSNRPVYGWDSGCSCGWERHSNDDKRNALSLHRAHLRGVRTALKSAVQVLTEHAMGDRL